MCLTAQKRVNAIWRDRTYLNVTCLICKIDSIENYYLIYAQDSVKKKYLIISKRDTLVQCQNIFVDKSYHFTFECPILYPMNSMDIRDLSYGGIQMPRDYGDADYHALELKGLYYDIKHREYVLEKRKELILFLEASKKNKNKIRKEYRKKYKNETIKMDKKTRKTLRSKGFIIL